MCKEQLGEDRKGIYIPADPDELEVKSEFLEKEPVPASDEFEARRESYFKNGRTNPMVWGPSQCYIPAHHGPQLGAHVESEWTSPEHWAHDNYQRGHLVQFCIKASGWKARLLSLLLFWTIKKTN